MSKRRRIANAIIGRFGFVIYRKTDQIVRHITVDGGVIRVDGTKPSFIEHVTVKNVRSGGGIRVDLTKE